MAKKSIKKEIKAKKRDFIDQDRPIMMEYYNLLEKSLSKDKLLGAMQKLIEKDPDFYDPYLAASDILFSKSENDQAVVFLMQGYLRAALRISDKDGNWPDEMLWGYLENRHIMRAIENYGMFLWESENNAAALNIFERLLRMNPYDNQGVRYNMLAIKLNLGIDEWEKPFIVKDKHGNELGLDGFKVHEWFDKYAPQFPEEFQWLLDYYAQNYDSK